MAKEPAKVNLTFERVPVRLVERRGPALVVEYDRPGAGPARAIVPEAAVEDGAASVEDLALGIPYGVPWEELWTPALTPQVLAGALRAAGIWTLADLRAHPKAAYGALQAAYGLDFAALIRAAETYQP